jgi:hypothetical protein
MSGILKRFQLIRCNLPADIQCQREMPLPHRGRFAYSINGRFSGFFPREAENMKALSNVGLLYDNQNIQIWKVPADFLGVQIITYGVNLFDGESVEFREEIESRGEVRQAPGNYPDAYSHFETDRFDLGYPSGHYLELKREGVSRF